MTQNTKRYDLLVFIGRFQPFHAGHRRVVETALNQCKHLLVLVGSSFQARTSKNPFTYDERYNMILGSLDPQHISRMTVRPLRDHLYNETNWIAEVQRHADALQIKGINGNKPEIGVIGYEKDSSSYYLKLFSEWGFVDVGNDYVDVIDATTIRNMWLTGQSPRFVDGAISKFTHNFIFNEFSKKEFERLSREHKHIADYQKQWANTPYPVQFNTVDAVVVQSGHVLLVKRKSAPGEGLWAMPGGFLNQNETMEKAVVRELIEETKIKVPDNLLKGIVKQTPRKVFDAPNRSLRGRTITNAFLIELAPGPLPKVKGSDDAAKAQWVSLSDLEKMEDQCFEDHFYIIQNMLGKI